MILNTGRMMKGIVQIPILIGLLIMAVAVPVATKLVQENQTNQGMAAGCTSAGGTSNYSKPCCSDTNSTNCTGSGMYATCKCVAKPAGTKTCTTRSCSNGACLTNTTTVPSGASCSNSTCDTSNDCKPAATAVPPTRIPPTQVPPTKVPCTPAGGAYSISSGWCCDGKTATMNGSLYVCPAAAKRSCTVNGATIADGGFISCASSGGISSAAFNYCSDGSVLGKDCASGTKCDNAQKKCVAIPTSGMNCSTDTNKDNACSCLQPSQCKSNNCVNRICTPSSVTPTLAGDCGQLFNKNTNCSCSIGLQCASGVCELNKCVSVPTGTCTGSMKCQNDLAYWTCSNGKFSTALGHCDSGRVCGDDPNTPEVKDICYIKATTPTVAPTSSGSNGADCNAAGGWCLNAGSTGQMTCSTGNLKQMDCKGFSVSVGNVTTPVNGGCCLPKLAATPTVKPLIPCCCNAGAPGQCYWGNSSGKCGTVLGQIQADNSKCGGINPNPTLTPVPTARPTTDPKCTSLYGKPVGCACSFYYECGSGKCQSGKCTTIPVTTPTSAPSKRFGCDSLLGRCTEVVGGAYTSIVDCYNTARCVAISPKPTPTAGECGMDGDSCRNNSKSCCTGQKCTPSGICITDYAAKLPTPTSISGPGGCNTSAVGIVNTFGCNYKFTADDAANYRCTKISGQCGNNTWTKLKRNADCSCEAVCENVGTCNWGDPGGPTVTPPSPTTGGGGGTGGSCSQKCSGNMLQDCAQKDSDGTSRDSVCSAVGIVGTCGGTNYCCPSVGGNWTTDMTKCPTNSCNRCSTIFNNQRTSFVSTTDCNGAPAVGTNVTRTYDASCKSGQDFCQRCSTVNSGEYVWWQPVSGKTCADDPVGATVYRAPKADCTTGSGRCTQCAGKPGAKLKGDADCDGETTINDYQIWIDEFRSGGLGQTNKTTWKADFDCSGVVDINDYQIWIDNFNKVN